MDKRRRGRVQSIEIGGELLEQLLLVGAPTTLTDLSTACGMQPAKVHRYLSSLTAIGMVVQQQDSGKYGLGPMALRLGLAAISQNDVIERASGLMKNLCDQHRVSGHLSVWSERGPVAIRIAHGGPPVISPIGVGSIFPLFRSATGQIFFAFMPSGATQEVAQAESDVIAGSDKDIESLLVEVQRNKFALASGVFIPGLNAVSFPIFGYDQSLSCSITFIKTGADYFLEKSQPTLEICNAINQHQKLWNL